MKDKIIVFGRGWYFNKKREGILQKYEIKAILDNSVFQEKDELGIPVYPLNYIKKLPKLPIVIMALNFWEMFRQLIAEGVAEERIRLGTHIMPFFDESERALYEHDSRIVIQDGKVRLTCDKGDFFLKNQEEYKKIIRSMMTDCDPIIDAIHTLPCVPISRRYGLERGKPIDRYYIEKFLKNFQNYILGDVMEIGDDRYTKKFGNSVEKSYILHVWENQNVLCGNLETGEGLIENSVNCLICTQTIQMIYDIHKVVQNIWRILKPGGVALITAHGIGELSLYDYYNWGEYWRFTSKSMRTLMEECFESKDIVVENYGNVKVAVALLYGLCIEDLVEEDFKYDDEQYPLVVAAKVRKSDNSNMQKQ